MNSEATMPTMPSMPNTETKLDTKPKTSTNAIESSINAVGDFVLDTFKESLSSLGKLIFG